MARPRFDELISIRDIDLTPVLTDAERMLSLLERFVRVVDSHDLRTSLMRRIGFPDTDTAAFLLVNQLALHGALRPSTLADRLETGRSHVTKLVARLHSHDLVARVADPEDRRGILVALTSSGRGIARQLIAAESEALGDTFGTWSDEDIETFTRYLQRFVADLSGTLPR